MNLNIKANFQWWVKKQRFEAFESGEDEEDADKDKTKHVVLSMAEIKDHEIEKKNDLNSLQFLQKRKSSEMNEYPSQQMLEEIQKDEIEEWFILNNF